MGFRLTTRGLTIAAILLTVVVVGIGVALAATSTPQFCATCKSHVPYVDEWRAVRARRRQLRAVPQQAGPVLLPHRQARGAAAADRIRSPATTRSPSSAPCSTSRAAAVTTTTLLYNPVSKNGIRVQHKHLIEAGFLCMRCHSTQAHGDAVPAGSRTYPCMDQCLHLPQQRVHGRRTARSRRHAATSATPSRTTAPSPRRTRRPTGSTTTAPSASSPPAAPATSRRTPAPSATTASTCRTPTAWISRARQASSSATGSKACDQCHDTKQYCKTCHQVKMPHPADFVASASRGRRATSAPAPASTATWWPTARRATSSTTAATRGPTSCFDGVKYTLPPAGAHVSPTTGGG